MFVPTCRCSCRFHSVTCGVTLEVKYEITLTFAGAASSTRDMRRLPLVPEPWPCVESSCDCVQLGEQGSEPDKAIR